MLDKMIFSIESINSLIYPRSDVVELLAFDFDGASEPGIIVIKTTIV